MTTMKQQFEPRDVKTLKVKKNAVVIDFGGIKILIHKEMERGLMYSRFHSHVILEVSSAGEITVTKGAQSNCRGNKMSA